MGSLSSYRLCAKVFETVLEQYLEPTLSLSILFHPFIVSELLLSLLLWLGTSSLMQLNIIIAHEAKIKTGYTRFYFQVISFYSYE